jgi:hypothetical protein
MSRIWVSHLQTKTTRLGRRLPVETRPSEVGCSLLCGKKTGIDPAGRNRPALPGDQPTGVIFSFGK